MLPGCLGLSPASGIESAAELQFHRQILTLSLTERLVVVDGSLRVVSVSRLLRVGRYILVAMGRYRSVAVDQLCVGCLLIEGHANGGISSEGTYTTRGYIHEGTSMRNEIHIDKT